MSGPNLPPSRAAAGLMEPRVILRPLGNPLPLGFLALTGGTLVLSGLQLQWFDVAEGSNVALILVAFVFPLQLLTSVFGYLSRDVVAGTGMGLLAGIWLSIALVSLTNPAGSTSDALGVFLLVAMMAMLVPAVTAVSDKVVPALVLATAALRFGTSGLYQLNDGLSWGRVTGYIGIALAAIAVYAALAMALEDRKGRTVLPLGRRGGGERALTGDLAAQTKGLSREAGVRREL